MSRTEVTPRGQANIIVSRKESISSENLILLALINKTPYPLEFRYGRKSFLVRPGEVYRVRIKSGKILSAKVSKEIRSETGRPIKKDLLIEKIERDSIIECRLFNDELKLLLRTD